MKRFVMLISGLAIGVGLACSQVPVPWRASADSPSETVETLWSIATAGELLTTTGWASASGLFANPLPPPQNVIRVVSNLWGPAGRPREVAANRAEVVVGCWNLGTIDSALRFTPAPHSDAVKEGELYRLILAPTRFQASKNSKRIQSEGAGYPTTWQISSPLGPPFTTVNTAIRYLLDRRAKTSDPALRQNIDKSLAALMLLH